MQQQEAFAAGCRPIAAIQARDTRCRRLQERLVSCDDLGRGIRPVREQREMKFASPGWRGSESQALDCSASASAS
jgi:hypothetical protein